MNIKSGVKLLSESEGTGEPVKNGDTVTVRLNGRLTGGESIQQDFVGEIRVGDRNVIAGIEYSIAGMKTGGIRRVKISPHLGYRTAGVPGRVPPNAVLIYEIELVGIKKGA